MAAFYSGTSITDFMNMDIMSLAEAFKNANRINKARKP